MNNRRLQYFAAFTAVATLVLIGMGGLVTSNEAGMAVADWPTTYGYNMFFFPVSQWVGGIFHEHTHRLMASVVGCLTVILVLWLYGTKARRFMFWMGLTLLVIGLATLPRRWSDGLVAVLTGAAFFGASFVWPRCEASPKWLRRCGLAAFIAVVLQGVLGGLRVVLHLDGLGVFHAALAQLFFLFICSIALFTSSWWQNLAAASPDSLSRRLSPFLLATSLLIFTQLLLGAAMRHQHAGLAIPDFPLAYGKLWPAMDSASVEIYNARRMEVVSANPITGFQIALQMIHRMMALVILAAVTFCAWSARRNLGKSHLLSKLTLGWVVLILAQALLGAFTIWSNKAADVATAHVLVGALSLMTGGLLYIMSYRNLMSAKTADSLAPAAEALPSSLVAHGAGGVK